MNRFKKLQNSLFNFETKRDNSTKELPNLDSNDNILLDSDTTTKEKQLHQAEQIAKIGRWQYRSDDHILHLSTHFKIICGFKDEETIDLNTFLAFVHPDDQSLFTKKNMNTKFYVSFRIYHKITHSLIYLQASGELEQNHEHTCHYVGVIQDISKEKQLEKQWLSREASIKYLHQHANNIFWIYDVELEKITYLSRAAETLFQQPIESILENPKIFFTFINNYEYQQVINGQKVEKQHKINLANDDNKWIYHTFIPTLNAEQHLTQIYGVMIDITSDKALEQQYNFLKYHDWLTKLPNQIQLKHQVNHLIRSKQSFTIYHLDLDRFSFINDSLGYQTGDLVLKEIAKRLRKILSKHLYLYRLASNDFIIIDSSTTEHETIQQQAHDIIKVINEKIWIDGYGLFLTTSIGIVTFPDHGKSKRQLLDNAHYALNEAKNKGKNTYQIFYNSHEIDSFKKFILEQDLRQAIKNEDFTLYYQPKVNVMTGEVESIEALIRWHHESWGVVSPSDFIPLAEENNLIDDITDWVIKEAIQQLSKWKLANLPLRPISINIPPSRFLKADIVPLINQLLIQANIPATYIELEITERTLIKDVHAVIETIKKLKNLGITIALDDFGTGYSSLKYLRTFHIDVLKIDQLFIRNIEKSNNKDAAIISGILHLTKSIGVKVVAEGVETYAQYQFLKQKECDLIQGYIFSKPVPVEKIEPIIKKGKLTLPIHHTRQKPEIEKRKFFRCELPNFLIGEMTIIELNHRRLNLGSAKILIENISIGGLKILSFLDLPVRSKLRLAFHFKLAGESFYLIGEIVWKNDTLFDTVYYGIEFAHISEQERDILASIINKLTVAIRNNKSIEDEQFLNGNPHHYLKKEK